MQQLRDQDKQPTKKPNTFFQTYRFPILTIFFACFLSIVFQLVLHFAIGSTAPWYKFFIGAGISIPLNIVALTFLWIFPKNQWQILTGIFLFFGAGFVFVFLFVPHFHASLLEWIFSIFLLSAGCFMTFWSRFTKKRNSQ